MGCLKLWNYGPLIFWAWNLIVYPQELHSEIAIGGSSYPARSTSRPMLIHIDLPQSDRSAIDQPSPRGPKNCGSEGHFAAQKFGSLIQSHCLWLLMLNHQILPLKITSRKHADVESDPSKLPVTIKQIRFGQFKLPCISEHHLLPIKIVKDFRTSSPWNSGTSNSTHHTHEILLHQSYLLKLP